MAASKSAWPKLALPAGFEFLLGGGPGGVGVGRRLHAGVDDEAEGLAGVVEGDDAVDQHEVEQRRAGRVLGGLRDGRLDAVDVFVADHADHAAHERGQPGHLGHAQAGELLLHQRKRIRRRGQGLLGAVTTDDLGTVFPGGQGEGGRGAAEAIATEFVSARDGLEEEGRAEGAEAGVDRDRGLQVGHQVQAHRDEVGLLGQLAESSLVGD
jgi:hypothetical protein